VRYYALTQGAPLTTASPWCAATLGSGIERLRRNVRMYANQYKCTVILAEVNNPSVIMRK